MSNPDQRTMSLSQTNRSDSKVASSKSPLIRKHSFHRFAFLTSIRERPVVYRSEDIDKHEGRRRSTLDGRRRPVRFDEGSLQLNNDPSTTIYQRLNNSLHKKSSIDSIPNENDEKLKFFEKYGEDLVEFIKDRNGQVKPKYDKVFII